MVMANKVEDTACAMADIVIDLSDRIEQLEFQINAMQHMMQQLFEEKKTTVH